jgi:hypothetical protein
VKEKFVDKRYAGSQRLAIYSSFAANKVHVTFYYFDLVIPRTEMRKVRGSSPVRDKDFRVRMRLPKYLGLVTLTSFG